MIKRSNFLSLKSNLDFSSLETGRDSFSSLPSGSRPDPNKDKEFDRKESKDVKLESANISLQATSLINAQDKASEPVMAPVSGPTISTLISSKKPQESTPTSTISAGERAHEIRENWYRYYFDIALKYINASMKNGELDEDQLIRLKIVLGPEKYWTVFQVKQKLFHLNWKYVSAQSSLAVCNLIQVAVSNYSQSLKGVKNLTKTQTEELLNTLNISIENWIKASQKEFEKNNLVRMSSELATQGYDSGMVNLKFLKVMARHYSIFMQGLKNEALLYGAVVKNFRATCDLEAFSEAINSQVAIGKKSATKIGRDIAEQESLICDNNLRQIELDYIKNSEAWIESDIKKQEANKRIYYSGLSPKKYISEIIQILSPAPYSYLEIKLSQTVDTSTGNSLLHYALKIFHGPRKFTVIN